MGDNIGSGSTEGKSSWEEGEEAGICHCGDEVFHPLSFSSSDLIG
jgi:hypothetical protein